MSHMKKIYQAPQCYITAIENTGHVMLYFSVHDEETEIIGAKEQNLGINDNDGLWDNLWDVEEEE